MSSVSRSIVRYVIKMEHIKTNQGNIFIEMQILELTEQLKTSIINIFDLWPSLDSVPQIKIVAALNLANSV